MKRGRETKPHIGIYGRCNSGKSTLLNFLVDGEVATVSTQPGTTTDPVRKSYEILGFAPVVFIDTPGLDDHTELGIKRVEKAEETLWQIDLALVVFRQWSGFEEAFRERLHSSGVPYLLVRNLFGGQEPVAEPMECVGPTGGCVSFDFSMGSSRDRDGLLAAIKKALPEKSYRQPSMFEGIASGSDVVMLVCPIDSEAPAGRLILPQVQAIRNLLDSRAIAVVVQPEQIRECMDKGIRPALVVTDSQAFDAVRTAVPPEIEVTSFSILLARIKGDMEQYLEGLKKTDRLRDGDRILILENCRHQVSCEDIGRVKIPAALGRFTGKKLEFTLVSGLDPLPADLPRYALAVQCGGCMATRSQVRNRIRAVTSAGVPVTNYGLLLKKLL